MKCDKHEYIFDAFLNRDCPFCEADKNFNFIREKNKILLEGYNNLFRRVNDFLKNSNSYTYTEALAIKRYKEKLVREFIKELNSHFDHLEEL